MKTTLLSPNGLKYAYVCTFIVLVLGAVSCKKDNIISNKVILGESKVKIINTTSTSALDFFVDEVKVNDQPLASGESSEYLKVASGTRNISTSNVNHSEMSMILVPTVYYSSFYVEDRTGKGYTVMLEDDMGPTESGKARIRFINASPNFTNVVNVNLTGNTLLVNSLAFKEVSGYFSVDPNEDLRVSVLGTGGVKILSGTAFEEGKIYTIWFGGSSNNNLTINKITYN